MVPPQARADRGAGALSQRPPALSPRGLRREPAGSKEPFAWSHLVLSSPQHLLPIPANESSLYQGVLPGSSDAATCLIHASIVIIAHASRFCQSRHVQSCQPAGPFFSKVEVDGPHPRRVHSGWNTSSLTRGNYGLAGSNIGLVTDLSDSVR